MFPGHYEVYYNEHFYYEDSLQVLLANSANTKCCPFQVNINHSKFIIDRLQQRFHVTFLIYLFVASRNLLFGVFLPRKIITILRKIAVNFRQVSLKEVLLSVSVLECFGGKVGSLKILYCT